MQYSKRIEKYCKMYQLDPEDVFFALLLLCECSKTEAYMIIYRPLSNVQKTLDQAARNLIQKKPGLQSLIDSFGNLGLKPLASKAEVARNEKTIEKKAKAKAGTYRDKESVLRELETLMGQVDEPKLKADLLFKISDLQQLKKETTQEEQKTVHYYLPLTCNKCALHQQFVRQQQKTGTAEKPTAPEKTDRQ